MRCFYHTLLTILISGLLYAEISPSNAKPAPVRPPTEAYVVAEDVEVSDTCEADKVCIEGRLHNTGVKIANQVKIHVEIGGTKHTKPRLVIIKKTDNPTMNPGDQQEFTLALDRKIPIKDHTGKEKIIEVGKYNFKIVPVWSQTTYKIQGNKKRKP